MADETPFKSERRRSRADIADVLRSLATALDGDGPVTLEDGARSIDIDPPETPLFEIDVERKADGMSLELELEWNEQGAAGEPTADAESDPSAADAAGDTGASTPTDAGATAADARAEGETVRSLGRFEIFLDRASEWRWRLVHRNGNIIATSGEGYTSKQNALKGMRSVMKNAPEAEVVSK